MEKSCAKPFSHNLKAIVNVHAAGVKPRCVFHKRSDAVHIENQKRNFPLGENSLHLGARSAVEVACVLGMLEDSAVIAEGDKLGDCQIYILVVKRVAALRASGYGAYELKARVALYEGICHGSFTDGRGACDNKQTVFSFHLFPLL